ncbi:MAG: hypothetical protein IPQ03_07435 [Bacteroidetes bacterium]|nr:hypothetical protein [Bacteroidota bacterium]
MKKTTGKQRWDSPLSRSGIRHLMMMMEFSQEKVFRFNLKGSTDNQFTFTFNPTLLAYSSAILF